MSDAGASPSPVTRPGWTAAALAWVVLPLLVLGAAIWWLYAANPLSSFYTAAPPVESVTFERTILDGSGIRFLVRAGGSQPMTIAQVQVDDGYWHFVQEPAGPIARGDTAWISVPYPWILGEAHMIKVVTNTGVTFEHAIAVAVPTPQADGNRLWTQAILGAFVGILPVAVGLMFYPALRGLGRSGMNFLLALTAGLLAFLLVDTLEDALDLAGESAALFQGPAMVIFAALGAFLLLVAISRRKGTPTGLALAFYIALGIGLHNLGEGLAIGAAFATGAAGLGTFLVLGFTLHNVTEGIGIAAPILKERPPLWSFAALVLLAGGPAVIGLWIGSLAFAPHWSALALAIGAGAILQVIVEVSAMLKRRDGWAGLLSPVAIGGFAAGVIVMYVTAMLVKI